MAQLPPLPPQRSQAATIPLDGAGDLLICLRKERNVIQHELAQRLGVPQQTIARWEREKYRSASLDNLVRVAHALNVDIYLTTDALNDAPNTVC